MKNKAFTLVELLVVILVIGIIAAIAYPQYQRATYKAIDAKLRLAFHDIAKAQNFYYSITGAYGNTGDEEKIDAPYPVENNRFIIGDGFSCKLASSGGPILTCSLSNPPCLIYYYIYNNHINCFTYSTSNFKADKFCQFITGQAEPGSDSNSYAHYYSGKPPYL